MCRFTWRLATTAPVDFDWVDHALVEATQAGLPLVPRPYHAIAERLGLAADEVMVRLDSLRQAGAVRRIGAVVNHYRLGYRANAMTVWDVADPQVAVLGRAIGAMPGVTHCYQRPRRPPHWPYNLFAMVHGRDRAETAVQIEAIAARLGPHVRGHAVLYSTRILKKTGVRIPPRVPTPAGR
jgi:DNA-binding Lrp family transcriptional regulator